MTAPVSAAERIRDGRSHTSTTSGSRRVQPARHRAPRDDQLPRRQPIEELGRNLVISPPAEMSTGSRATPRPESTSCILSSNFGHPAADTIENDAPLRYRGDASPELTSAQVGRTCRTRPASDCVADIRVRRADRSDLGPKGLAHFAHLPVAINAVTLRCAGGRRVDIAVGRGRPVRKLVEGDIASALGQIGQATCLCSGELDHLGMPRQR